MGMPFLRIVSYMDIRMGLLYACPEMGRTSLRLAIIRIFMVAVPQGHAPKALSAEAEATGRCEEPPEEDEEGG